MELTVYKSFIISKQIESLNGRNLEKIHEDVFRGKISEIIKDIENDQICNM